MYHVIFPYPSSIKLLNSCKLVILNGTARKDLPALITAFRGHLLRSVCYYCCSSGTCSSYVANSLSWIWLWRFGMILDCLVPSIEKRFLPCRRVHY